MREELVPIPDDVSEQVLALFGTVANAAKLLRLNHLPYQTLLAAMRGSPVKESFEVEITEAWRRWKQQFIRGVVLGVVQRETWRLAADLETELARLDKEEALEWKRRLK